jgi:PhnB protein
MSKPVTHTGSGVFLTFSGNCREAFTLYHTCFGGELLIEDFTQSIGEYAEQPVIRAVLHAPKLTIQGSDLVYNEGRRVGNYIAVLVACKNHEERKDYISRLYDHENTRVITEHDDPLVEIIDRFDVRWMFAI